jgi:hypothetical protein
MKGMSQVRVFVDPEMSTQRMRPWSRQPKFVRYIEGGAMVLLLEINSSNRSCVYVVIPDIRAHQF